MTSSSSSSSSTTSSEDDLSSQICNTCFIRKDFADFGKTMKSDNGYNPKCKVCVKNKINSVANVKKRKQ